jgi:hypothetical protein
MIQINKSSETINFNLTIQAIKSESIGSIQRLRLLFTYLGQNA